MTDKSKVIPLRKGRQRIKNYEIICEILNSFVPLEKKVLILHLGLFGNNSHTDFEIFYNFWSIWHSLCSRLAIFTKSAQTVADIPAKVTLRGRL